MYDHRQNPKNRGIEDVIKKRGHFPNDEAATKLI
jgi:transposase-like protein